MMMMMMMMMMIRVIVREKWTRVNEERVETERLNVDLES
jgi:hypothetical protein